MTGSASRLLLATLLSLLCVAPVCAQLTYNKIKNTGTIRLLLREAAGAERLGQSNLQLGRDFAGRLGVGATLVRKSTQRDLVQALLAGEGDLIIEPMVLGLERPDGVSPSLPLTETQAWVIASPFLPIKKGLSTLSSPIAVPFGSDLWSMVLEARQTHPNLALSIVSSGKPQSELNDAVAAGRHTYGVTLDQELDRNSDARIAFSLKEKLPLGWLMRAEDRVLRAHVDNFIQIHSLTRDFGEPEAADWQAIKSRGTLRLITLNRPDTYFTAGGELLGFEYEMVRRFARQHELGLDVVVAAREADLIPMLEANEGDLAAGFITPSAAVRARGVTFTTPYHASVGHLVGRRGDRRPLHPVDLLHTSVAVSLDSPYLDHLRSIQTAGVSFDLKLLPAGTEDAFVMEGVRSGQFQYGVADRFLVQVDEAISGQVIGAMSVGDAEQHAWAVRLSNQTLLKQLNQFWAQTYQTSVHRRTHYKYFAEGGEAQPYKSEYTYLANQGQISPYDDLVQRYARYYDFDWRLILAVMYEESRFDPAAVSSAGARGLMQVKDVAAEEVGIADVAAPKDAIHAGVKYLDWVRSHLEVDLDVRDRIWLSLVGYNAGIARLLDARTLAADMGLDPRRWHGQVEAAFSRLPQSGMRDGKHETLSPDTTIAYIERIQARFQAYVRLTNAREQAQRQNEDMVKAIRVLETLPIAGGLD